MIHGPSRCGVRICVYDNPATMHREAWKDGRLVASISLALLETKGFEGHPSIFFGLNVGQWESGKLRGDPAAMREPAMRGRHY